MVRDFRNEFGLTQEHLATLLNKTRSYVSAMERGKRDITAPMLVKLHEYRDEITRKISFATEAGLTVNYPHHEEQKRMLYKQWNERLDKVEDKIQMINMQLELNSERKRAHSEAHSKLNSFVYMLEDDVLGKVFKNSHTKKSRQVKDIPNKELNDELALECLQAEVEIIRKYLAKYFDVAEDPETPAVYGSEAPY
jgi:transcriptional regulator with XRE-family HTH domain